MHYPGKVHVAYSWAQINSKEPKKMKNIATGFPKRHQNNLARTASRQVLEQSPNVCQVMRENRRQMLVSKAAVLLT